MLWFFNLGSILNFSAVLIPTLVLPASNGKATYDANHKPGASISHIATQWRHAYTLGKSTMPILALGSGTAYAYLAYSFRQEGTLRAADVTTSNWYLLAAGLVWSIIPYTLLPMNQTIKKLLGRASVADAESITGKEKEVLGKPVSRDDVEVLNWLKSWAEMNCVRGLLPLAGTLAAAYATLY
ncbi:hypothetical protein FQN57_005915 [Myotisia sp. PD_48]|nr:hypothetical protein FQN57_005915 [Myotisia sp. PD_48]